MSTTQTRQLTAHLQAVINDAEALLKETADDTGTRLQGLRGRLGETLANARERAIEMESAVADRTRAAARSTDRYVRDNPWQTVGIVAAVGVLLGVLLSRR